MAKASENKAVNVRFPLERAPKYAAMVATCNQQVGTIQKCGDYPNQPAVQAGCTAVLASASALNKTLTDLATAEALVATLQTTRGQQALALVRDHAGLESSVNIASQGQKAAGVAWGGKISGRVKPTPSTDAPLTVAVKATKTMGAVTASCKADRQATCYLFQQGGDPAHPETWPAPTIASKSRLTVTGLTVGTKAYFRVAIVRRGTGTGEWSGVVEVTVR